MLNLPILLIFKDSLTVLPHAPPRGLLTYEAAPLGTQWNRNHPAVMFIKTTTEWTVLDNAPD